MKEIVSKCFLCKRMEGKYYSTPAAPPLPSYHVADDFGFTSVGIDHARPVFVKNIYESYGTMYKAYITVITCTVTRAIHLELSPDLNADSLIRAPNRFKSRRGIPALVVSDNGRTFKDRKVKAFLLRDRVEWRFNVPCASWWGGFFEICVKLVKKSLKKILKNAYLTFEEFLTILTEIEAVLNSRHLTYSYDEFGEPLTPSTLILGKRLLTVPDKVDFKDKLEEENSESLNKRACYLSILLDRFRSRWRKEYLTGLREFHNCNIKKHLARPVKVGDIVSIYDDKETVVAYWTYYRGIKRKGWKCSISCCKNCKQ